MDELLRAAVAEFASAGYEAATMSGIAERAGAPIGSLYQFFPNKQAVARAVRTRQIEDAERLWRDLPTGSVAEFVERFVEMMVVFVKDHRAFLPLLDAPSSTLPVGPRHRLRRQLEGLLRGLQPGLARGEEARIAEMMLRINKAIMGLYASASRDDRGWVTAEYRGLLGAFLTARLGGSASARKPLARRSTPRGRGGPDRALG